MQAKCSTPSSLIEINPFEQQRQFGPTQRHCAATLSTFRPAEASSFQPLRADPQPAAVKVEHLDPVSGAVTEHEEMSAEGIGSADGLRQRKEPFKAFAHVGCSCGQINPRGTP